MSSKKQPHNALRQPADIKPPAPPMAPFVNAFHIPSLAWKVLLWTLAFAAIFWILGSSPMVWTAVVCGAFTTIMVILFSMWKRIERRRVLDMRLVGG